MTQLGKILVFVTVALSFVMLAWSAALYLNRIDWSNHPAKGEQPAGVLVESQERIKTGTGDLELARNRWRDALKGVNVQERTPRAGLVEWENRRDADLAWYQQKLTEARFGPGGTAEKPVDKPIQRVALKDGLAILDPQKVQEHHGNRPQMVEAVRRKAKGEGRQACDELYSYDYYVRKLAQLSNDIVAVSAQYQAAMKEDSDLTDKAIGPKGLRQQIIDEQEKIERIDEELKDVQGRQTNSRVETELLLSRRAQLQRRINELKRTAVEERP